MWYKQHSGLWAGCKKNQRSKDSMQETCVKKTLDMCQTNLVANNEKEHAALLRNLKTQRTLDGMQHCTCDNNMKMSTAETSAFYGLKTMIMIQHK